MSSSIGKILDDYKDYQTLCEFLDIPPLGIRRNGADEMSFYEHEEQILEEEGCETHYEIYQKVK